MQLQGLDAVAVGHSKGIVFSQHDIHEQAVGGQMISTCGSVSREVCAGLEEESASE